MSDGMILMGSRASEVHLDSLYESRVPDVLIALARGEAAVAIIDDAVDPECCAEIGRRAERSHMEGYSVEPDFQRSGLPLFEAARSRRLREYFSEGPEIVRELRSAVAPYLTPEARVRLALDEMWPAGASLLRIDNRVCPFGLIRMVRAGGAVEPHTDNSDLDYHHPVFMAAQTNLSWVAYLTDSLGGELCIWPEGFVTAEALDRNRLRGHPYALDTRSLSAPRATVAPRSGRMVIFNARFVHSVGPVLEGQGPRVSQSGFLLIGDSSRPLGLYH